MCQGKCDCKPVSKQNPNFQVGDVVEWCGTEGVVKEVLHPDYSFPIVCMFGDFESHFREDGKYVPWHVKPSLILVSRPKRKVTKKISSWVNVYRDNGLFGEYGSKEEADGCSGTGRIACVELTGTYEVEE